MFWNERSAQTVTRGARIGRCYIPLNLTEEQRDMIADVCSQTANCSSRMNFVSGAIVWFESLPREEQINAIDGVVPGKNYANISVPDCISNKVRSWHFPAFSLSRTVTAIVLKFTTLDAEIRSEWVNEAFHLICSHG